jgi:hypothetical protein
MKTERTHFNIATGNEPMQFSKEFQEAVKTVKTDLRQVERKLAEDLCQRQDKHIAIALLEKLASP